MSWIHKLTSEETRALLRSAAKLVLELVGDESSTMAADETDAAKIASAVAASASVASQVVAAASRASKRTRGSVALGLAVGAALGAGALFLASPAGRARVRAVVHKVRGWRRPPVEIPPP